MNMFKKVAVAIAAVSVVAAPLAASAAPLAQLRALSILDEDSEAEGSTGIIIGVVAAAAVVGGIVALADGGDDTPTSP